MAKVELRHREEMALNTAVLFIFFLKSFIFLKATSL